MSPVQVVTPSVSRRWFRAFCATCEEPTVFDVRTDWTSVCTKCAKEEIRLAANGLLRMTA